MKQDFQKLIDEYVKWLRDKTYLRSLSGDWMEITTPHLDRHNDYLQIYVRQHDDKLLLSDGGYTLEDLELSGCQISSPKRKQLLVNTLNALGVSNQKGALQVEALPNEFPLKKHNLLQAMLAVNDLFYLAAPVVASLFLEDVTNWLDSSEIRYTPQVKFTGQSGFDHMFDFVIPKSTKNPERIVQAITRPTRDSAEASAFRWIDTKLVRPKDSIAYAILNDAGDSIPSSVVEAFKNYEMKPILWHERQKYAKELAA